MQYTSNPIRNLSHKKQGYSRLYSSLLLSLAALVLVSCGEKPAETTESAAAPTEETAKAGEEEKVLNIYNWSDYLAEDTIPNFEKETVLKYVMTYLTAMRFCMQK